MQKQIKRFRVRSVSAMVASFYRACAWAVEPFKVRDIRVEGLQRVEPEPFSPRCLSASANYNDEKGAAAIRALFGLGLFKDVRLESQRQCAGGDGRGAPHRGRCGFRRRQSSTRKR